MTSKIRAYAADPQRLAARAVFGAMLALLLVLVMLPLGKSIAQTATTIQIINPHPDTSLVISDKGRPYHLNSWVNQVPANPIVEYELIDADENPTTIGTATQVGTDTFEFFWTIDEATLPDGDYTLKATLFTQGTGTPTEVASDTQAVVLNNQEGDLPAGVPDADDQAETVEIVYPENAGDLGVYVTPGEPKEQSFIMEVQTSTDRFVRGFYSVTERGTEPDFKPCGGFRQVDAATRSLTFECVVPNTDFALGITAVAAVTNDTPPPANTSQTQAGFTDSADAHSVDSYFQRAGSVVLEPETIGDAPLGSCATFTATVIDQNARPISNMNVDAHAAGPDDNLRFDTGTDTTSTSNDTKAPDQNHTASEPAFECAGATSDTDPSDSGAPEGTQGDHNDPTGSDRKHVESVAGTGVTGSVPFSLRSATAGVTQLTVWADADDDDRYCSQEQADAGSIGWGQAATTPVREAAEVSTCSVAEPSPSPSPTPTATATTTGSPSPTATTSGSPSPTPTTSVSPTPDPDDGDRTFTRFVSSKRSVRKGGFVRFTAILSADDPSCQNGVAVKLKAKFQDKRFITLKTKVTNTEGKVRFRVKVTKTKVYKAVAPPESFCERAKSELKRVRARG